MNKFIPAANAAQLSARCKTALIAASDLMETMTGDLPVEKKQALMNLLTGGGRVGVELTVDKHANNLVSLIGIEREGGRLVLATVKTIAQGLAH